MADKSFVPICGQLAVVVLLLVVSVAVLADSSLAADVSQPMSSFTVTVIDEEQQPIEGVLVRPWALRSVEGHGHWSVGNMGDSEPLNQTTNEQGEATVHYPIYSNFDERIETTYVTVGVEHDAYVDSSLNEIPVTEEFLKEEDKEGSPLTVVMDRGVQVTLVAENDINLADGELFALWSSKAWNSTSQRNRTDAKTIVLPRVDVGKQLVRLVLIKDGKATYFSRVETLDLKKGTDVEIQLAMTPAITVRGTISEKVPRSVKNGRVSAYIGKKLPDSYQSVTWWSWAPVDEQGNFTLSGLPDKGTLQVIALADGWIAERGEPPRDADERAERNYKKGLRTPQCFSLDQMIDQGITLSMEPLVDCHFRFETSAGEPIENATVRTWPNIFWYEGGSQVYCDTLMNQSKLLLYPNRSFYELVATGYECPFTGTSNASGQTMIASPSNCQRSYVVQHDQYELPIVAGEREASFEVPESGSVEVKVVLQLKSGDVLGNWDKASEVLSTCTSAACLALREDERFAKLQDKSRDLFKELESNPDPSLKAMAYQALAEALEQLGEPEQAKRSLKVAIEAAPSDKKPELSEQLKKLDEQLGD